MTGYTEDQIAVSATINATNDQFILTIDDATPKTLPKYALKVLTDLEAAFGTDKYTYFLGIVYCIALESGFTPHITANQMREIAVKESDVTCYGRYHAKLCTKFSECATNVVQPFLEFYKIELEIFPFTTELYRMILIKSDDSLCVTLTGKNAPGQSLYLPVSRYVPLLKKQNKSACFRNLRELSIKLKNLMFLPIRDSILMTLNCFVPSMQGIPTEIFDLILSNLDKAAVIELSLTNWKIRENCMQFWKRKLQRLK